MKLIFILLCLVFISCNTGSIKQDVSIAPIDVNHRRLVFNIKDKTFVGIGGTISRADPVTLQTYNQTGDVAIKGLADCGYTFGTGFKNVYTMDLDLLDTPDQDICVLQLTTRVNGFDAIGYGNLIIRRFTDPNIIPLDIKVNGEVRKGVNWIQIKEDSDYDVATLTGITENREVEVYPNGTSGNIVVTGCGISPVVEAYYFGAGEPHIWRTNLSYLYAQSPNKIITKSCVFTVTANNNDSLKQTATFFVAVYKQMGSFLYAPVPIVKEDKMCFEFQDLYVIGVKINEVMSNPNARVLCVPKASQYEVEGITSKFRTFYGIFKENKWLLIR